MTELSPQAHAVLNAFNREARPEPHHQREAIAAALRTAAVYCTRERRILLTIADELEGADA
jgi:hypothetical protein